MSAHTAHALGRSGLFLLGNETLPRSDLKGIGDLTSSFASARRSSTSEKLKLASVMNWLTTDTNLSPVC